MDEPTLNSLKYWVELLKNAAELIAFVFGAAWAWFKIREFRQFKNWIELEIDSNLHKLQTFTSSTCHSDHAKFPAAS